MVLMLGSGSLSKPSFCTVILIKSIRIRARVVVAAACKPAVSLKTSTVKPIKKANKKTIKFEVSKGSNNIKVYISTVWEGYKTQYS